MTARPRTVALSGVSMLACVLPVLVTACRGSAQPSDLISVRDSAGVHIVESTRADGDDAWQVADSPVFRIGREAGGPRFRLIDVGVVRPDGSSVVGDGGSATVYLISASGEIVSTLRGEGEGPGQTLEPSGIIRLGGDTILVHNAPNLRLETFVGDRLVRELEFSDIFFGEASYTIFGRTDDGRLLLNPTGFDDSAFEGAVGWKDYPILGIGTDFSGVDTVASIPIIYSTPVGDPIRYWGEPMWTGRQLAYALTDRAEVRWLPRDGSTARVVRWAATAEQPDDELWNEYEAAYRADHANLDTATLDERLAGARRDFVGPLPFFQSAHADLLENVWLEDYRITLGRADSYLVVSPEGGLHRVRFPEAVHVLDVADTLVLAEQENDLGEQAVVLYRLEKRR